MSGRLFIVSGPSGAGKSSLCAALLAECPSLNLSISCTTRKPRPGEVDGREYHFLAVSDFEVQREQGDFLEWASVHGNLYGTRQRDVEAQLQHDHDVLLEIDWQGARQVAEKMPDAIRVFILPPSLVELRRRLSGRGQDDEVTVNRRMAAAEMEMSHAGEAAYQVVNDDFATTLAALRTIFS
ncbi:MAG: guanylate kinase [Zetaproteobacteria bacterium CG12_big_fil_rev_8_21_14_0_65_54_13]|nr:MAG: guanylate kinase [Zetaproteobacteria bacterium CG23_combo_of_CG06-09_8_20_14_all_54_7]PIW47944.1 MAG: guanylate kinase [Zetaproteobacteria bacterium CG12_big_fil_rev_8_21_14_0_65_54_13]PIX53793.1 MAG: guanylate kinase [Zetaproteobacteria bacterium CG_4_10_14_3_um_filter_54_28]PJA30865.1 MAG: guanylate kinase [Zetaproteobacteria bacterium CG_4_9_14_3_um_filter_54_145]